MRTCLLTLGIAISVLAADPQVQMQLHHSPITAHEPITVAVDMHIPSGWHLYWRNPGDAGLAPRFSWQLPDGWTAGDITWPQPHILHYEGITTFGYKDHLRLTTTLQGPSDAVGPIDYQLKVSWLICKEACIPQSHVFSGQIIHDKAVTIEPSAALPLSQVTGWDTALRVTDTDVELRLVHQGGTDPGVVQCLSTHAGWSAPLSAEQKRDGSDIVLTIPILEGAQLPEQFGFLLFAQHGWNTDLPNQGWEFFANISKNTSAVHATGVSSPPKAVTWHPFNPKTLTDHETTKQKYFIDFTATWCGICQVNKKNVLRTLPIQQAFQQANVHVYEADWSNEDPVITQALTQHGAESVPVYIYFDGERHHRLPNVLSTDLILNYLKETP